MASSFGKNLKVTLDGTSHGPYVSISISGLPIGSVFSTYEVSNMLKRRRPKSALETSRVEDDEIELINGIKEEYGKYIVDGSEVLIHIKNKNIRKSDYSKFLDTPRPGHADYTAIMKDKENVEISGGGRFSGRLTVGLCLVGSFAISLLKERGIYVSSEIVEIGGCSDKEEFNNIIESIKEEGDSLGGIVKVSVTGLKAGEIGDSYFSGIESAISNAIFGIPAVKGISFGSGFRGSRMKGSENNDEFYFDSNMEVKTRTNNHGGILGGISSGMPITFTVAIKPTPSISKPQGTVNLRTKEDDIIEITGRHDPCVALRVPPVLESVTALEILDLLMENEKEEKENFDNLSLGDIRREINKENEIILSSFLRRLDLAKKVAIEKNALDKPLKDISREEEIISSIKEKTSDEYKECVEDLFRNIFDITLSFEEEYLKDNRKPFGLLGKNISESLSPFVHNMISNLTKEKYSYELFDMDLEDIKDFIGNREFSGLNVTMPHKREVITYLDELTDIADEIGSVNTIYIKDGKLYGDNTDYFGFKHTLSINKVDIKEKNCLILGNGGASDSIYLALLNLGAKKVVRLSHTDLDNRKQYDYMNFDILINATPYGKGLTFGESLVDLNSFINLQFVMDLNYVPLNTKLIQDAKILGIKNSNGLDMLVSQAVASFEDFMGLELNLKDCEEYISKIKNEILKKQNIILIGMPGVGKTVVGKALSERLGKDFYDTDDMILYRTGKKPSEIIEAHGEKYFRECEMDACTVLSEVTNSVISTGGGVVLNESNYYSLSNYGTIVYLKKDLNLLDKSDRPLSKNLFEVFSRREEKYILWSNLEVDCDNKEVEQIVNEILERL